MCWLGAGRASGVEGTEDALDHRSGVRPDHEYRVPVASTPCQVVGQLAASRLRTRTAECGKPKPTRQVARTATRSLVKNTERSAFTSASRRTTVVTLPADIPQMVPTG